MDEKNRKVDEAFKSVGFDPNNIAGYCSKCDGTIAGKEPYVLGFAGQHLTFCSRACMNAWGKANLKGWQS